MLQSIHRVLNALDSNGILYCHWKSNEHLQEAIEGETDLDILFLPEQRSMVDKVLNECAVKRFRSVPLMQYNAIEDFIGMDEEKGRIWHLHTHYQLTIGEKHLKGYTITPWTEYIIKNRVLDEKGIYTVSPEIELVLLLSRISLKLRFRDLWRSVGTDDKVEFAWLKDRISEHIFMEHAKAMVSEGAYKEMCDLIRRGLSSKNEFFKLRKLLLDEFAPYTGYSLWSSRLMRTKRELFWLVGGVSRRLNLNPCTPYRRVSPSGGTVVAFLGCDGAGKSTTIDYVRKEFGKKIDVKSIYLGSGDGSSSLLRKPMKFVAKRIGGKGVGSSVRREYSSKERVSIKAKLYSVAKIIWALTLAKEKQKKLKEVTMARNKGMLVLIDRYPQTEVYGYSDGPLLTKYLGKGKGLLYRMAKWEYSVYRLGYRNPPNLTIKLMVPTDVALKRKPEMTAEEIDNKKAAVRSINISRSIEINTDCPKEDSISKVMKAIWQIV